MTVALFRLTEHLRLVKDLLDQAPGTYFVTTLESINGNYSPALYFYAMTAARDPYETLAAYYDDMHAALTEDIGMVLSLAAKGSPLLELGCGTGRLLLPLARAGHTVFGVDRSRAMLAVAQERLGPLGSRARERVHLICADMTRPVCRESFFELALIPYNTLMHLDAAAAAAAFCAIRRQLAPGGQLFIDVVNPLVVEETTHEHQLTLERQFEDDDSGDLILVLAANELDVTRQMLKITWLFDRSPRSGGCLHRDVVQVDYHYYFPHQIELMLQEAGLALAAIYGGYQASPYSEESERLLIVARRPQ